MTNGAEAAESPQQRRRVSNYLPHHRRAAFDARARWSFPGLETAQAAVLRSDIVGFTQLTDRMVQSGMAGAEELAEVLNRVINRMAEIAWAHGGELAIWEGDAGTFVWFAREGLTLDDAVLLAAQSALAIHREAVSWPIDGVAIQFRSAVGCGSLSHFAIGGIDEEWHSALAGDALQGVIAAGKLAEPGAVVLSRAAAELAGGRCQIAPVEDAATRVIDVLRPAERPRTPPRSGEVPLQAQRSAAAPIAGGGGRGQPEWPGEFRVVTVAYIRLRQPEYALAEETLTTLHDAARRVQKCLARFEGQIYLIVPEEEGVTFIALFGLPPWPHEDDAARAVKAALALHREWGALGLTSSTGIATGRVFCGAFQTATDHTVLALVGPTMNLAARLMQLNAGIVCDDETRQGGRQAGRIIARQLTPRSIKGKSEPVIAYAAYDVVGSSGTARAAEDPPVIGRQREILVLSEALSKACAGGGGAFVIEGDAGIGKTTLVNRTITQARDAGLIVLAGGGDSTDSSTPYLGWRAVFLTLLGQSDLTLKRATAQVWRPEAATPDLRPGETKLPLAGFAPLLPLLEEMFGWETVDNSETALLVGQARADALARLLRDLLFEAAKRARLLVVMEDMHWLDPTSLKVFADLTAAGPPVLLLGTARGPDANPAVRRALAQETEAQWLRPDPMTVAETGLLVARTLGAREADDHLAAMFRDRTGGNPLFVEELARMAFVNRLLFIDGAVQTRTSVTTARDELDRLLERQGLPGTIEGVIRRRLDDISHRDVSVLRAASVAGQTFHRDLCSAGAPSLNSGELERSLATLIGAGVIDPSGTSPDEFVFRHEVLRDVVYNSMSFAERRQLHDAIGSFIERQPHAEDVSALLGRHFLHAQRTGKAIRCLTRAGELAIRGFANSEAVELLTRAHELAHARPGRSLDDGVSRAETAHLSLLLGRAHQGLSRYADCQRHCEAGLRLVGFRAPAHPLGVGLALAGQAAQLMRHRLWRSGRQTPDAEKAPLREAVFAFEALAETYFYSGDGLRTLNAAMSALNLSERLGASPETARGCATMAGIAGFFRLRKASNHYSARALAILDSLEDPAAETWVYMLLGLSRLAEGRWELARAFLAKVLAAATKSGDRRRWRDGVENAAVIEACRGKWKVAQVGLTEMYEAAREDKDQRYLVMAARERAYCSLQLGDGDAVDRDLKLIRDELGRGLTAEEPATWLDLHALAATRALERGDDVEAAREAAAAIAAVIALSGKSTVANAYWSLLLVARAFTNLALFSKGADGDYVKGLAAACRAMSGQAWSYPIAAPSAQVAHGYLAHVRGRRAAAARRWRNAAAKAERLEMAYEARLARHALGGFSAETSPEAGLAFLTDRSSAHGG